jgi:hypothetical protein
MIQAELKGKLPEVENMEDVLTSNVFGLLNFLSFKEGLYSIIKDARNLDGDSFDKVLLKQGIKLEDYSDFELLFWECSEFGEPDLIVILKGKALENLMFVIEVKFNSEKSGFGEDDQLKRYYLSLYSDGNRKKYSNKKIINFEGKFAGIIYLKPFVEKNEIKDSILELSKKKIDAKDNLFGLEWNTITKQVCDDLKICKEEYKRRVLKCIYDLLLFKNFRDFEGWEILSSLEIKSAGTIFFETDKKYIFNGFSCYNGAKINYDKSIFFEEA